MSDRVMVLKSWFRGKAVLIAASLGILIFALWCFVSEVKITEVMVKGPSGGVSRISLPYSIRVGNGKVLEFTLKARKNVFTWERVRMVPDDHLLSMTVNGQELLFNGLVRGSLRWPEGFSYPLGRFLKAGENVLVLKVRNDGGGPGGLGPIVSASRDARNIGVLVLIFLWAPFLLGGLLRWLGVSWKDFFVY